MKIFIKRYPNLKNTRLIRDNILYVNYVLCRKQMLETCITIHHRQKKEKALDFLIQVLIQAILLLPILQSRSFQDILTAFYPGTLKESYTRAIATRFLFRIKDSYTKDGLIRNNVLADLSYCLTLNKLYYDRTQPADNIRKILSLMRSQSETDSIRNTASIQLEKNQTRHLPGIAFLTFHLLTATGKWKTLKDFKGRFLLLSFARSDDPPSLTELSVVSMWQNMRKTFRS